MIGKLFVLSVFVGLLAWIVRHLVKSYRENRDSLGRDNEGNHICNMAEEGYAAALFRELEVEASKVADGKYIIMYHNLPVEIFFNEDDKGLCVVFNRFATCTYDQRYPFLRALNSINMEYPMNFFLSYTSEESEKPLQACCRYVFMERVTVVQCADVIKELFSAFINARGKFPQMFENELKDSSYGGLNDVNNDISHRVNHFLCHRGVAKAVDAVKEGMAYEGFSLSGIMSMVPAADLSGIRNVRIIADGIMIEPDSINDVLSKDVNLLLQEYGYKEYGASNARVTVLVDLETENFTFDFRKVVRTGNDEALYYNMLVTRNFDTVGLNEGENLEFKLKAVVEVCAGEGNELELQYALDEARELSAEGKDDELSDLHRLLLAAGDENLKSRIYWGLKHFYNGNYLQAMHYLKGARCAFVNSEHEYCTICYILGVIYMELGMYDTAYCYLDQVYKKNMFIYDRVYARCVSWLGTPDAVEVIRPMRNKLLQLMDLPEDGVADEGDELLSVYYEINRYYVISLVKNNEFELALEHLYLMKRNGEDETFVADMLASIEYLKMDKKQD